MFTLCPKGIAAASAIIFLCWIPVLVLLFPGEITYDGVNQLHQFATPGPTWYSTLGIYVDGEYIDHHPVFVSLLYGFFVFKLGGVLGSHALGLFAFILFQAILSSFALGVGVCYLQRFGAPFALRVAACFFAALFPAFPLYAVVMLKDSLHAPLFLLFCVLYAEMCHVYDKTQPPQTARDVQSSSATSVSRNVSLRTPSHINCPRHRRVAPLRLLMALLIVAVVLCASKKTGAPVVAVSLLVLLARYRSKELLAVGATYAVILALVPAFTYPLLGGVASGGKQEALGVALQQTVATNMAHPHELSSADQAAIQAVLDVQSAQDAFAPDSVDPVKRKFNQQATTADIVNYLRVYLLQGVQHPLAYATTVYNCNGSLYVPTQAIGFYIGNRDRDVPRFYATSGYSADDFPLNIAGLSRCNTLAIQLNDIYWNTLAVWPVTRTLLSKGLYGGIVPLLCFMVLLVRNRKRIVAYIPILLTVCTLFICPVPDTRYILPLIYTTFFALAIAWEGLGCGRLNYSFLLSEWQGTGILL